MTKSRMAALLLALGAAGPAAAAPAADEALESYSRSFPSLAELDCPRGANGEIVVCGRRDDGPNPDRLPLPVEPEPGRRLQGETVSAVQAAGVREKCSTVGPNQNCGGGLPVFAIAVTIAKIVKDKIIDPED